MSSRIHLVFRVTALVAIAAVSGATMAQQPNPAVQLGGGLVGTPNFGPFNMQSNLGSFRLSDGTGRLRFSFTGTVLVSNLRDLKLPNGQTLPARLDVEGNVRTEHNRGDRRIFTGTGTITVQGQWRKVQWFGRNMTGAFYGNGIMFFVGDFDENLQTGTYWFDNPERRRFFFQGGATIMVPEQKFEPQRQPEPRRRGG
jgi:hypothetical protein